MNRQRDLRRELSRLVDEFGAEEVLSSISSEISRYAAGDECTIIVNAGIHDFPAQILIGENFVFSEGNLNIGSPADFQDDIVGCIERLAKFLRRKKWKRIYTVVSGHPALCMHVKLTVFRVTKMETIDWIYDGEGGYFPLKINVREHIAASSERRDPRFETLR